MKECQECLKVLPYSEYKQSKRTKDGYDKKCLYCCAAVAGQTYDEYVWYLVSRSSLGQKRTTKDRKRIDIWQKNNKEKTRQYSKNNYENNKEEYIAYAKNRKLKEKGTQGEFNVEDWKKLKKQYNNSCAYCGASNVKLEKEHIIPISRGGEHSKSNIVPACTKCNDMKYTYLLEELGWPDPRISL